MGFIRAVSDTISTVLLATVILTITMIIAGVTLYAMTLSSKRLEFEQMRTTYIALAQSISSMLSGGDFYSVIPTFETSFGYRDAGVIAVDSAEEQIAKLKCLILESRFTGLGVDGEKYFGPLGQDARVVSDARLIPSVYAIVERGATLLRLDTCRLLASFEVKSDPYEASRLIYFLTISFINLNTTIVQEGRTGDALVYARIEGDPVQYTWLGDGSLLRITFPDETVLNIRDLIEEYPGGTVRLDIIVYNLRVEVRV
ncbi:MAG: hypothetical protein QXP68_06945 [Thermosphaera sp.]